MARSGSPASPSASGQDRNCDVMRVTLPECKYTFLHKLSSPLCMLYVPYFSVTLSLSLSVCLSLTSHPSTGTRNTTTISQRVMMLGNQGPKWGTAVVVWTTYTQGRTSERGAGRFNYHVGASSPTNKRRFADEAAVIAAGSAPAGNPLGHPSLGDHIKMRRRSSSSLTCLQWNDACQSATLSASVPFYPFAPAARELSLCVLDSIIIMTTMMVVRQLQQRINYRIGFPCAVDGVVHMYSCAVHVHQ